MGFTALALCLSALGQEPVLQRWLDAWRRGTPVEARHVQLFEQNLQSLFAADPNGEATRRTVREHALGAIECSSILTRDGAPSGEHRRLYRVGLEALSASSGWRDWLLQDVIPSARQHPAARRATALRLLAKEGEASLVTPLLVVARRADDPIRPLALELLVDESVEHGADEAIDRFLVELQGRSADPRATPHPFNLLRRRILEVDAPLGERASETLSERLKAMLLSRDWREAARAVQLARGLEVERRVPLLLDALSSWSRRSASGRGSKRIEGDLVRELQRISGRTIGRDPRNWITWWVAVRQGRVELPPEGQPARAGDGGGAVSRSSFFGLRPSTDQVTFIVDHSGSMAQSWGTEGHSRYEEAIEQMIRFLQASGPTTRFNVILFDSEVIRSSVELVEATPRNLERARKSMLSRPPDGGTNLRPAVELASGWERGRFNPDSAYADTIVVLCDGATAEGASWVAPFLDRIRAPTQVVFHCVLLGSRGDGALEALADGTGGDFVRVGG